MAVKVLVVDDQEIMRKGISTLLRRYTDCEVTAEAADGHEALKRISEVHPDIVILDVSMPNMSGTETAQRMIEQDADIKILAVSAYTEVSVITEIIRAGASGYILKDNLFQELAEGINTLRQGNKYFSHAIAGVIPAELYQH